MLGETEVEGRVSVGFWGAVLERAWESWEQIGAAVEKSFCALCDERWRDCGGVLEDGRQWRALNRSCLDRWDCFGFHFAVWLRGLRLWKFVCCLRDAEPGIRVGGVFRWPPPSQVLAG